jgi:two-component system, chemotaxis family, sensor kinase CheA
MTEELEAFSQDMDEQLGIMEDTLMDISDISIEDVDSEMIDKLFRAMHTMKGNAGMFGFDNVVSFAHTAENLLNAIREHKIVLTQEMVELFLLVNDHSRTLIDVTLQEEPLDEEQIEYHNDILRQLTTFLNTEAPLHVKVYSAIATEKAPSSYMITIKPKDSFFISDMDIVAIIKYLGVIGNIEHLDIQDDKLPNIQEIISLKSYLSISIKYECEEPLADIEAAFEFVIDDIELSIVSEKVKYPDKQEKKTLLKKNASLRVDSSKIDQLINIIGEMVIANAKITQIANDEDNTELIETTDKLTGMLEEIREGVMDIRMVQVGSSFQKLRRIVNDTAKKLGKEIKFVITGEDTELDKTVIEKISDPLVHMLRNSIDHGIELPKTRIENDKDKEGQISIHAYPDSGSIVIEVEDDGAGISKDIILQKAIENGLVSDDKILSDKEIYKLIFAAGLSTATNVSDVSGRGVGMDVVRKNIEELKGSVEVDSTLGKGTKITIRLPLTLAIIDGFLMQTGATKYILPLDMIQECIELTPDLKAKMKNNKYINLRGHILPLINTSDYFDDNTVEHEREYIIIVDASNQKAGLIVDEIHGEFQTVIKPLGEVFEQLVWISGGTILGSGDVALILDIPMLLSSVSSEKTQIQGYQNE